MLIDKKFILPGLLLLLVLGGCTGSKLDSISTEEVEIEAKAYHIQALDSCKEIQVSDGWRQEVENFSLIFDPSASMSEQYMPLKPCVDCHVGYNGSANYHGHVVQQDNRDNHHVDDSVCEKCHGDLDFEKFHFAKRLARCLNKSIPQLNMKGSLRTFGSSVYSSSTDKTPPVYEREKFDRNIRALLEAEGSSPLAWAFKNTVKDWYRSKGKIALIVMSDGKDIGDADVLAAEKLKERYGSNICFYTVHVGNDQSGLKVMDEIVQVGKCGASISSDELLVAANREEFVRSIFLKEMVDNDNDGVWDDVDDCPNTAAGLPVNERGCWKAVVMSDVLFDSGAATIKPEGEEALQAVVDYLEGRPVLKVRVAGHTDNVGGMEYNKTLSKQRAEAGKAYLVAKGISEERITVSWHGYSSPVASNSTASGRAQNRRIEFSITK